MATSAIETALVEATGFEPTKNYERQDYLAALARAVNDLDEADFDSLEVEAQDWFNLAVKALNKKKDLPDFPDLEGEDEAEADDSTGDDTEDDTTDDAETDEAEDDAEEEAPEPPKKVVKIKSRMLQEQEAAKKPMVSKKKPYNVKKLPPPNASTGEVDKFGQKLDSQGHKACEMLEQGSRMSALTEEIGGTYYNLLKKLVKEGHKIEKSPNGIITLIHKDGTPKKAKVKK